MSGIAKYLCSLFLAGIILTTNLTMARAEDDTPSFDLDQIVITATKTPVKLSEAGANVSVVTREEIEKMHYRDVGEALRNVPGFNIVGFGSTGGRNGFAGINGTSNILVLMDGKRMNLPNQLGGMAAVDFTNITNMDNIERIEVVKGSASALYGSDAEGGIINIITKNPQQNKTILKFTSGSFGKQSYGIIHEGKEDTLSWYLTATKEKIDNFKDSNALEVPSSSNDAKQYSLKLNKQLGNSAEVTFSYQKYDGDGYYPGNQNWLNNYGSAPGHMKEKDESWDVAYSSSNEKGTRSEIKLYENTNKYSVDGLEWNWNLFPPALQNSAYYYDMKKTGLTYQLSYQANENHLVIAGLDYYKDQLESDEVTKVSNENRAVYFQDRWKLSERFDLDAGMRFDSHQVYGNKTTPRVTLNYHPTKDTNCYISYDEFFKAPNLYQLYFENSWGKGNPDLKPEKGHSIEFGLNQKIDNTLTAAFHCFDRRTDDAINWKTINTLTWQGTYMNVDKQKASGWDIQLNKKFTPELTAFVGYTSTIVKNDKNDGKGYIKDGNIPKATLDVGASYIKEKYDFEIKGREIIDRPGNPGNPNQILFPESTYWIWDTTLNVKVKDNTKAFLKINNLFNQYYAESSNVNSGGPEDWYPAPGRSYLFGVDYSF